MHPWLKLFSSYVHKQFPSIQHNLQHSLLFIQNYCKQQNILQFTEACDFLSTATFITIQDICLIRNGFVSTLSISEDKNKATKHRYVLVCCLSWQKLDQSKAYLLKDGTGEIECLLLSKASKTLNDEIVMLTNWSYIPSNCAEKPIFSYFGELRRDLLDYVEINNVVLFTLAKNDTSNFATETSFMSISEYFEMYQSCKNHKMINLKGLVVSKSPIHKLRGCNPFFLIRLQCVYNTAKSVVVVIQGHENIHWNNCIQLFHIAQMTNLKHTVMNKGKKEERIILCAKQTSAISLSVDVNKKVTIEPAHLHLNTVHYTGVITSTKDAEFGLYYLDYKIKLLVSHQPCLDLGKGLRKGASIKLYNVHKLDIEDEVILCCCTISTVQIERFSDEETSFNPFVAQLHPIASKCQELSASEYLWIIQSLKKINSLQKSCDVNKWAQNDFWRSVFKILSSFTKSENKRSIFSEFIDLPHACVFTQRIKQPSVRLMFVNDLLHMCEEYEDSENSKWLTSSLDWMNGREFDQYQNVCDDNKWQYTIIDSDLLEKKLVIFGLVKYENGMPKLISGDNWISITGLSQYHEFDETLVFVKKFKLVWEKFSYLELDKPTGKISEKHLQKQYIIVESSNLTAVTENETIVVTKKPRIEETTINSQKNIVTGTVIAREFKRSQHLSYDVELHHDNMVYIPSIGRINPTSIIQSNQSFYPLTTSVLILRVLEQESKEKLSIYFDSNKLQYPLALLPGALIKITNVNKVTSKRGSVYYKANLSSTLEILTYSPSTFESLRDLIHQKEEEADVEMEKTMVISCNQNTNLNLNHRSNGVFLIIGRISLVHSVHGKWKCLECFKHVTENVCSPGCRGRRIFALELRCAFDDGSAECYLHIDDVNAERILELSKVDIALLKSVAHKDGGVTYQRSSITHEASRWQEKISEKQKCELLLQQKISNYSLYRCRRFRCKRFRRKENSTGYQNSILVSDGTEYHTLSLPKLLLQCISFKPVNYKMEIQKSMMELVV